MVRRRKRHNNITKTKISRALKKAHKKGLFTTTAKAGAVITGGAVFGGVVGGSIARHRARRQTDKAAPLVKGSIDQRYDELEKNLAKETSSKINAKNYRIAGAVYDKMRSDLQQSRRNEHLITESNYLAGELKKTRKGARKGAALGAGAVATYAAISTAQARKKKDASTTRHTRRRKKR